MKIKSLFHFAIYIYMIDEVILSNKWIEGINNVSAIVGCQGQLVWEFFANDTQVSIYKISREGGEHRLSNSGKYHIDTSHVHKISITITNITMDDAGVYRCQGNAVTEKWADLYLTVAGDKLWKDTPTVFRVSVGDDVTLMWEHFINDIGKHKTVYKQTRGTTDIYDDIGKWDNEKLTDKGDDSRMKFNIMESGDGRTEIVMLTIHNTRIEDFNYIYNMKIQFPNNCVRYGKPVSVIEAILVNSLKTELAGRPSENITFLWSYRYSAIATRIIFNKYNDLREQVQMGNWTKNRFDSNMGEGRLIFGKLSVVGGENITLTLLRTVDGDFNTIYGCNITFGDGLTGYNETKLIFTQDVHPRITVPGNQQMYGRIGHRITLVFTYYYSFPVFSIGVTRTKSEPSEVIWKDVIDDDRRIFQNSSILGGGQISLIILNTTVQDYNTVYKCEVIFTNRQSVFAVIELILLSDTVMPETEKTTFERNLMIALVIGMVLTSFIIGVVVCRYKCGSRKSERPRLASYSTNNMRHSYISLNSVVIFHANRDSTTTNAESTGSNDIDDDTDAYANPYDPINRDGIDTSKNLYMSLQNPGASNINQGDDVQETDVDGNSVTTIDDVQTADDHDDDDDDTSTHDSKSYDALNKYTMNSDIHSYLSLPPCTRSEYRKNDHLHISSLVDDLKIVKKRPSTI